MVILNTYQAVEQALDYALRVAAAATVDVDAVACVTYDVQSRCSQDMLVWVGNLLHEQFNAIYQAWV